MKFLVLLLLLITTTGVAAESTNILLEVRFKRDQDKHTYKLSEKSKDQFVFTFDDGKEIKNLSLTKSEADNIKTDATRIIWENQYRAKKQKNCSEYVTLKTPSDRAVVCKENTVIVGKAFGFLNRLNQMFQK